MSDIDMSDPKVHAKFDLYATRFEQGDWFTCQLYRLFDKADEGNKARLAIVFPLESEVWHEWYFAPSEREYFAEFIADRQQQA